MEPNVQLIVDEIEEGISYLSDISTHLSSLSPVSHLSKARIQWVGGIGGAIREYREDKRLMKLINAPLFQEKSFYNISFIIIEKAEDLSAKQANLQKLLTKDDPLYFGLAQRIEIAVNACFASWFNYSPDMAYAPLTIEDEKNVSLFATVDHYTKEAFKQMDRSGYVEENKSSEKTSGKAGCLGLLITVAITFLGIIGGICLFYHIL
ncbi:MAG: hypothetical protein IJK74_06630 [Bacteroidales bacterium]|nr:hypothetical protein [Bacteroidales bacterium]